MGVCQRNQKRKYRGTYDYYNNFEKNEAKEQDYYKKKEKLLTAIEPLCIHKEFIGFHRTRHYDYESHFDTHLTLGLFNGTICHSGHFYDRDYDYYDRSDGEVYFFDELDFDKPEYNYYVFYVVGEHSYHTPVKETELNTKYKGIPVIPIDRIVTEGHEIIDLASVAFADKVIELIESGEYTYEREMLHFEEEDIYESDYISFLSERKDRIISDNIEHTLQFWGSYIAEFLSKKYKSMEIEQGNLSEEDIALETEEYREKLHDSIRCKFKNIEIQIMNLAKTENQKAKEKKKRRLQKKISGIGMTFKENKKFITEMTLDEVMRMYDTEYTYAPYEANSLDDVKTVFMESGYFETVAKSIAINQLRRKIFEDFKENELPKYVSSYLIRIEGC